MTIASTHSTALPTVAGGARRRDAGQLVTIAGGQLPHRYRRRLERFRYGPGVFKVDYALVRPGAVGRSRRRRAATVHVGGTGAEIAAWEAAVWRGEHPDRPFVLVAQQSLFDPTRAPPASTPCGPTATYPPGRPST